MNNDSVLWTRGSVLWLMAAASALRGGRKWFCCSSPHGCWVIPFPLLVISPGCNRQQCFTPLWYFSPLEGSWYSGLTITADFLVALPSSSGSSWDLERAFKFLIWTWETVWGVTVGRHLLCNHTVGTVCPCTCYGHVKQVRLWNDLLYTRKKKNLFSILQHGLYKSRGVKGDFTGVLIPLLSSEMIHFPSAQCVAKDIPGRSNSLCKGKDTSANVEEQSGCWGKSCSL